MYPQFHRIPCLAREPLISLPPVEATITRLHM